MIRIANTRDTPRRSEYAPLTRAETVDLLEMSYVFSFNVDGLTSQLQLTLPVILVAKFKYKKLSIFFRLLSLWNNSGPLTTGKSAFCK